MGKFSASDFDFAPAWRALQGDIIQGEVIERSTRETEYGEYPILVLETDEPARVKSDSGEFEYVAGQVAIHGIHTAIKNQIEEKNPQPGDYVGVLYQGKIERTDAESFFGYRMKVTPAIRSEVKSASESVPGQDPSPDLIAVPDDTDPLPF